MPRNSEKNGVTVETVSLQSQRQFTVIQWTSLVMVALAFVAVYAPTFGWLWKRWMMGVWYQAHGVLVPFVAAYLIWRRLRNYKGEGAAKDSALGFLLLVPALLMHVVDTRLWSQILSAVSIVPALMGLSLLFLGRSRTFAILFPLLLLFFMIPLPSAAIQPVILVLRKLSAVGTEEALKSIGITLFRSGTSLEFINGSLNIDDPCSGFSTLAATVIFTLIVLYIGRINHFRSLIILAFAPPVALCANIFRCTMLSLMFLHLGRESLNTFLHPLSGYAAYAMGIGLQFGILELLRRRRE